LEAYGWHVIPNVDGHDVVALEAAIQAAKAETGKPPWSAGKTIIGKGSPNKRHPHVHGAALATTRSCDRKNMGWGPPAAFEIPADIYAGWDARPRARGWKRCGTTKFARVQGGYPKEAAEFERA